MNLDRLKKFGPAKLGLLGFVMFFSLYVTAEQLIRLIFNPVGKYTDEIVLYGTERCPYCRKIRNCFAKEKIEYTNKDIEKDFIASFEHMALRHPGVPIVVINEDVLYGYSIEKLRELLSKNGQTVECKQI